MSAFKKKLQTNLVDTLISAEGMQAFRQHEWLSEHMDTQLPNEN